MIFNNKKELNPLINFISLGADRNTGGEFERKGGTGMSGAGGTGSSKTKEKRDKDDAKTIAERSMLSKALDSVAAKLKLPTSVPTPSQYSIKRAELTKKYPNTMKNLTFDEQRAVSYVSAAVNNLGQRDLLLGGPVGVAGTMMKGLFDAVKGNNNDAIVKEAASKFKLSGSQLTKVNDAWASIKKEGGEALTAQRKDDQRADRLDSKQDRLNAANALTAQTTTPATATGTAATATTAAQTGFNDPLATAGGMTNAQFGFNPNLGGFQPLNVDFSQFTNQQPSGMQVPQQQQPNLNQGIFPQGFIRNV